MFPLQFLFDPVPTTRSIVFHRVNGPSYCSIPKKLVLSFLYFVPVLSLVTRVPFVFPHTHCKSTYIFHILLFGLACAPTPRLVVFPLLLVRQRIAPHLTIYTLAVPLSQIYSIYSTKHLSPFSPMPWLSS
jgi:hypothetical protein